jgi:hypothetical protein
MNRIRLLCAAIVVAFPFAAATATTLQVAKITPEAACTPSMFFDLRPGSQIIDVTKPMPDEINVPPGADILVMRPWPTVGADVKVEFNGTDGDDAQLLSLLAEDRTSAPLCIVLMKQWRVQREGTGLIVVTTTPVTPNATPEIHFIKVVSLKKN